MTISKPIVLASPTIDAVHLADGIDKYLPYLHNEHWAQRAAELDDIEAHAEGAAKIAARQAVQDHYKDINRPESSRIPLLQAALQKRRQT